MSELPESPYGPARDENKGAIPEEQKQAMHDQDVLIAKTFNSAAGKKVLEWLRTEYVESYQAGYVVDRNGTINANATTFDIYQREGKRMLVKNIEMRMKRSNTA